MVAPWIVIGISKEAWERLPPKRKQQIRKLIKAKAVGLAKTIARRRIGNPRRPPKVWFDKIMRRIARMKKYRDFPLKRKQRIVAGIWHGYSPTTKARLLRRYD